jgi:hypothetical protein
MKALVVQPKERRQDSGLRTVNFKEETDNNEFSGNEGQKIRAATPQLADGYTQNQRKAKVQIL